MHQRKIRRRLYSTENLFVYSTSNGTYGIEGIISSRRIRKRAKSLDEAIATCHCLEEDSRDLHIVRTHLTSKQIRDAEHCFDFLPEGASLTEIATQFNRAEEASKISPDNAVWKYLETKEHCSLSTYKQAKSLLLSFTVKCKEKNLHSIDTDSVVTHLLSVSPRSYNHHLRAIKGFFTWAKNEGFCIFNPCDNIKPRKAKHTEVGVLTCEDAEALLCASRRQHGGELVAYTAVVLFAGLRPDSEMRHLTWEAINLEDAEIRVTMGKTRIPRTVRISENLVQWLNICDRSQPIYPVSFRSKWAAIRNAAGFKGGAAYTRAKKAAEADLKPWIKDYTRHSAISYRVRQTGDIHRTATWAGNSPRIINSHYLGLVTGSDARRYWDIRP